jgi:hypothetical protein
MLVAQRHKAKINRAVKYSGGLISSGVLSGNMERPDE